MMSYFSNICLRQFRGCRLLLVLFQLILCGVTSHTSLESSEFHKLNVEVLKTPNSEGTCALDEDQAKDENWDSGSGVDGTEYIVRFNEYLMQDEHRIALEAALNKLTASSETFRATSPRKQPISETNETESYEEELESVPLVLDSDSWRWVSRTNLAAKFPTDFGLLALSPKLVGSRDSSESSGVLERLTEALGVVAPGLVKDVHGQQRITRSLSWDDKERSGMFSRRWGRNLREVQEEEEVEWSPALDKQPGRLRTKSSYQVHDQQEEPLVASAASVNLTSSSGRSLLAARGATRSITDAFNANQLWKKGFSGDKVRMAVFDTGVRSDHPHFRKIKERSNWTHENTLNDGLGHGTFVAGVIASQMEGCLGFAPDAEIHTFRVFTNDQVSYTSWFLDAFNYAIATEMHILNLSIGGPDYLDRPFVEKVWELTSNNIIMVSAIGNDGPLYGTLNNPADQMDVIGVGGIDYQDNIAGFSSRGMSTWELPHGYGRTKPDVVAYGRDVFGSKIQGGCRSLSGTSVASPVVAGAVVLLVSTVPEEVRWKLLNPAVIKQALIESADKIHGPNVHEQGMGRLNLLGAHKILEKYKPRASIEPARLDLTECPYMWPHCRQPLYHSAMPTILNCTIINGMGLTGWLEGPPVWQRGSGGEHLDLQFTFPDVIWPWAGYLGIYIRVKDSAANFKGNVEGIIAFTVISPPAPGETENRRSQVALPVKARIIPTPPRRQRILWDNYHSVRYPPAYIPRDNLDVRQDILDWHGDHPHTNYHDMYDSLVAAGMFLEMLGSPFTCFDASNYHALLLVDSEEEYHPQEVDKLREDVTERGLSLIVFAEWYNVETMIKMRFFDDNTRSWWTPATGGGNIPALNDLLGQFGVAFGDTILAGTYPLGGNARVAYNSGANLVRFPAGGLLYSFPLSEKTHSNQIARGSRFGSASSKQHAVMGLLNLQGPKAGRLAVHGDSNCLDSSHLLQQQNCFNLLLKMLDFAATGVPDSSVFPKVFPLQAPIGSSSTQLPMRRTDVDFTEISRVLNNKPVCGLDTPPHFQPSSSPPDSNPLPQSSSTDSPDVSSQEKVKEDVTSSGITSMEKTGVPELSTIPRPEKIQPNFNPAPAVVIPKIDSVPQAMPSSTHDAVPSVLQTVDTSRPDSSMMLETSSTQVQPEVSALEGTLDRARVPSIIAGDQDLTQKPDIRDSGAIEAEQAEQADALDENAQLQSASVSTIVHQTSRVDPVHRTDNEQLGVEFREVDANMKIFLVFIGGLLVGGMISVTSKFTGKRRSRASRETGRGSSIRARSGRTAGLLRK